MDSNFFVYFNTKNYIRMMLALQELKMTTALEEPLYRHTSTYTYTNL